ncbi:DNA polymerase epsilon subunit 4 [Corvus kubaryi]|uniref:DNA polymerase epsilon subunit 4 n=1 Tax=Corvus kubaryi TaxID=68294 RepID=UPI001C054881|nr:DNA polymerase epsilon subunit 4 [Corvus kubaryi]
MVRQHKEEEKEEEELLVYHKFGPADVGHSRPTKSCWPKSHIQRKAPVLGSDCRMQGDGTRRGAGPQGPGPARLARLPLARVKALVKADPDVTLASQEAVFVLARATELFVETIAKDAYVYAQQGKRKTLQRKDLDNAIEAIDEFAFLEGTLD